MTQFTRDIPDNPLLRKYGGDLLPSTTWEAMSAAVTDPRLRPTQELGTQLQLGQESGNNTLRDVLSLSNVFVGPLLQLAYPDKKNLSELVPPDKLNEEYKSLGLKFDKPTRRKVAEILAQQKKEDLIRQDIMNRAPGGVFGTGAVLTASLAGSIIDPLNVSLAFVPVVGEARYALWADRMGPTLARFARGAVEGAVGNAAVEPFTYTLSKSQQLDYSMMDSLLNIGLGGVIGGGLHAVGGRFVDALSRQPPEVRDSSIRASVAQLAQGKSVDVTPIVNAEPKISMADINARYEAETRVRQILADPRTRTDAIAAANKLAGDPRNIIANIEALKAGPATETGLVQFLKQTGGLKEQGGELKNMGITPKSLPGLIRKNGQALDDAARAAWESGLFPGLSQRPTVAQFLDKLSTEVNQGQKAGLPELGGMTPDHAAQLEQVLNEMGLSPATDSPQLIADVVNRLAQEPPFGNPDLSPVRRVDVAEMIRNEASPQRDSAADFHASEQASLDVQRASTENARSLTEQAAQDVQALQASGNLDADLAAQLGVADEFGNISDGWARAVRQAGYCLS